MIGTVIAFLDVLPIIDGEQNTDISPLAKSTEIHLTGHTLVVPKQHYARA